MEKELKKKRKEIMSIRRTGNRKRKDDLNSRKQLIVIIRVNGWTNRGRNKKTKQTRTRKEKTHMTNKSVAAIKTETLGGDKGDENNTEGNNTMSRTRNSGRKNKRTNLTSI